MALRGYRPVVRDPVRRLRLPGLRPDRQPGRQDARPLASAHVKIPMVIRIPFGGGIGAVEHHSESPEAYFAHTAGLRVVACSQPRGRPLDDPAGRSSADDPVIFFEPKRRYWDKGEVRRRAAAPRGLFDGQRAARGHRRDARRLRPDGQDMLAGRRRGRGRGHEHRGHRPALALAARPIDDHRRRRCARPAALVVVHEASHASSAWRPRSRRQVTEQCFYELEAPVHPRRRRTTSPTRRAGSRRSSSPTSTAILDAVDRALAY